MRIAAAQFDIAWEARRRNYDKVTTLAGQAAEHGADLLVLPEMFATGFSLNPAITAEPENGESTAFLRDTAREHGLGVIGGVVIRAVGGRGRNTAIMVDKTGTVIAQYAKIHLFSLMEEAKYHEPGIQPVVFEFEGLRASTVICYDLRFPELFRLVAPSCHVIFVIASWPAARQTHFDMLLPARAIENQVYVVGVNRIGSGGGHEYRGGTAIISPLGESLAHAGGVERLVFADIDPAKVEEAREAMSCLQDRKIYSIPTDHFIN